LEKDKLFINRPENQTHIEIPVNITFLPLVQTFVDKASIAFGFAQEEAIKLTLAADEIFSYLCHLNNETGRLAIKCINGGYYVRIDFDLMRKDLDMRAFNLAATVQFDESEGFEEMGLLIASRMVDRFSIHKKNDGNLQLTVIKEKSYPLFEKKHTIATQKSENFFVTEPDNEELKLFIELINNNIKDMILPLPFKYPGKVSDMVTSGEYSALIAKIDSGKIIGGLLWHWSSLKIVEFFGPYILAEPVVKISKAILDECINSVARTPVLGMVNRFPCSHVSIEQFEELGNITLFNDNISEKAAPTILTTYFRQMQEDAGTISWSDQSLEQFLKEQYTKMFLPRDIRLVKDAGETHNRHSVLSTEFDSFYKQVKLKPVIAGADIMKNITEHLLLFQKEDLRNIFFEMDLGESWHSGFIAPLIKNEFSPRMIIPHGGKGDLLILQKDSATI